MEMITEYFDPLFPTHLVAHRCCPNWCNLWIPIRDVIQIRAGFYRSLRDDVSAENIRNCVSAYLYARLDIPPDVNGQELVKVTIDRSIFKRPVCQEFFLGVLCISERVFDKMLRCIVFGDPYVPNRLGVIGQLGEQTIRSIARIGVESSLVGQFNPLCGSIMLARGESKKYFLRTNSRFGTLTKDKLDKYVGVGIRRRGVDSFMRCDVCMTLGQEFRRVASLVRMCNGDKKKRRTVESSNGAQSLTARAHQAKVISMRKLVLYSLFRRYANARKNTAMLRSREQGREVDIREISVDEIVPNEHVKTEMYCKLLNARTRRDQDPFTITPELVHQSEILQMSEEDIDMFVDGHLHEDDFSLVRDRESLDVSRREGMDDRPHDGQDIGDDIVDGQDMAIDNDDNGSGGAPDGEEAYAEYDDGDEIDEEALGVVLDRMAEAANTAATVKFANSNASRRLKLLNAFQRLKTLRSFHAEHVTAERVITYAAFETGAKMPASVLAFTADGMSKDKTKLPNKEKGKNAETLARLDCYVTGLQMSVANSSVTKAHLKAKERDVVRIHELNSLKKLMKKNPRAYTDDEKIAVDEELKFFDDKDAASASGYALANHDFIYPYGWGGAPSTDALVSNLLHVLRSDQVAYVPRCIALVLDNASVNKSINTLRAFALLLELIPRLQEVHLYFPTVGHTHNSLDAHFGAISKVIEKEDIGTPTELACVIESVENTTAHIDFNYYKFASKIGQYSPSYEFDYLGQQHYFHIYKDKHGDIRFDNMAFLRFAESLSHRVNYVASITRDLIPLSEDEMRNGCPIFVEGNRGKCERISFAKRCFPRRRYPRKFTANSSALMDQLKLADMGTDKRKADLEALMLPRDGDRLSLYDMCCEINAKTPYDNGDDGVSGELEELAIAMKLRLRGRTYRSNAMTMTAKTAFENAGDGYVKKFIDLLLAGDDGSLRTIFIDKIRRHQDVDARKRGEFDFKHGLDYLKDGSLDSTPPQTLVDSSDDELDDDGMDSDSSVFSISGPGQSAIQTISPGSKRKRSRRTIYADIHPDTKRLVSPPNVRDMNENDDDPVSMAVDPSIRSKRAVKKPAKYTPSPK